MFLLVPAHSGCPGQNPESDKLFCVYVCVCVCVCVCARACVHGSKNILRHQ